MALSEHTIETVEQTLPALRERDIDFACQFYKRMLGNNPTLKDIFNMANQRDLSQPRALFDSVVGYASHLRDLAAFGPAVERIAQKHASLNILPEQYPIVGENLLATLQSELHLSDEVIEEWRKAYGQLASILIKREEEIYREHEQEQGWRGTRPFKVAEKEKISDVVMRFKLVPADGKPVMRHRPGQYLTLFCRDPSMEYQEIRQYSITSAPNTSYYEIAVRRHDRGLVSRYLHDTVHVDDTLQVGSPCGDFFFAPDTADATTPIALISGNIGVTPMMSILRSLAAESTPRPVFWLHAAHSCKSRAFHEEVQRLRAQLPGLEMKEWVSVVTPEDKQGADYEYQGHVDVTQEPRLFESEKTEFYFVGGYEFMKGIQQQLLAKGVPVERMHFEYFSPFKVLA